MDTYYARHLLECNMCAGIRFKEAKDMHENTQPQNTQGPSPAPSSNIYIVNNNYQFNINIQTLIVIGDKLLTPVVDHYFEKSVPSRR